MPEARVSMEPREVFEMMRTHLLKQGVKSGAIETPDYSLYHCEDGRKCPVGIFIPKGRAAAVEGCTADDALVHASLRIQVTPQIERILIAVQNLHDDVPPEAWAARLHALARKFGFEKRKPPPRRAKKGRQR